MTSRRALLNGWPRPYGILLLTLLILAVASSGQAYFITTATTVALFAIVAIGLDLFLGYTGQASFGQNAFILIGAFATGILTVKLSWQPLAAIAVGVAISALVAVVIAKPLLRTHGHYLAMATLAVGTIAVQLSLRWTSLTGGQTGIPGVPDFSVGSLSVHAGVPLLLLAWTLTLVLQLGAWRLTGSRFGRSLRAIAADEDLALSIGIPVAHQKMVAFVISAAYASIAGSLFAHYLNYVYGIYFGTELLIPVLAILAIGGSGYPWGPIVGSIVFIGLLPVAFSVTGAYSSLLQALAFALALLTLPRGLAGGRLAFGRSWSPAQRAAESAIRAEMLERPEPPSSA